MERKQEDGIRCVERNSPEYPEKLKNYKDMPERLYVRGKLPENGRPSAAIVGARMCSPYGRIQAFHYAKALSEAGVQIISGLAWGIDSEGHKGRWRVVPLLLPFWETGRMSVIPGEIRSYIKGSCVSREEFSVNILRELSRGNIFFLPGTELSAHFPTWCWWWRQKKKAAL